MKTRESSGVVGATFVRTNSPQGLAALNREWDKVIAYVKNDFDIREGLAGESLLISVVGNGKYDDSPDYLKLVKLLLKRGAEVNFKSTNEDGWTALHKAAAYGDTAVVALLLEKHADVNSRDSIGRTPLHLAAADRYPDVHLIRRLIKHGADVKAVQGDGRSVKQLLDEYARDEKAFDKVTKLLDKAENTSSRSSSFAAFFSSSNANSIAPPPAPETSVKASPKKT